MRFAWHGIGFTLPAGWDITAHDLRAERGRIRLHQRLEPVAELLWVRMVQADIPRLAEELQAKERALAGLPAAAAGCSKEGAWTLVHSPGAPVQALLHDALDGRLLVWTLPREHADLPTLLASYAPDRDGRLHWRLFAAEAVLPRAFVPETVEAVPGTVRLRFSGSRQGVVEVRRLGCARHHLGADAETGLDRILRHLVGAGGGETVMTTPGTFRGHRALRATLLQHRDGWERSFLPRIPGRALLWHDVQANRLGFAAAWGPKRTILPEVDDVVPT